MPQAKARKALVGQVITKVDIRRSWDPGNRSWINELIGITLEDGRRMGFMAVETIDAPAPVLLDFGRD